MSPSDNDNNYNIQKELHLKRLYWYHPWYSIAFKTTFKHYVCYQVSNGKLLADIFV